MITDENLNEINSLIISAKEAEIRQLHQERDALAAYCEELKKVVHGVVNDGMWVGDDWIVSDNVTERAEAMLYKTPKNPQTCLAEHDARVRREFADWLHSKYRLALNLQLEEYAQQLREDAKSE